MLHIYIVLRLLPELPEIGDPSAPSAPPETDLRDVDPEQADFSARLKRAFQRCVEVSYGRAESMGQGCRSKIVSDMGRWN